MRQEVDRALADTLLKLKSQEDVISFDDLDTVEFHSSDEVKKIETILKAVEKEVENRMKYLIYSLRDEE